MRDGSACLAIALGSAALTGCFLSHEADRHFDGAARYTLVDKRELAGPWEMTLRPYTGREWTVRFAFDEDLLLVGDADPPVDFDRPADEPEPYLVGFPIEAHVAVSGDECSPWDDTPCLDREPAGTRWYERSMASVGWERARVVDPATFVLPLDAMSVDVPLAERVDPLRRATRDRDGSPIGFDVPVHFDSGDAWTLRFRRP